MINAMRAYLCTEDKVDYRNCEIQYYTYTMFETPNKYRVNVNVHIQTPKRQVKKTLNTDSSFDSENEAIDYAIDQGKKFIDQNYEAGKISFIKEDEPRKVFGPVRAKSTAYAPPKPQSEQRKDQK